MGLYLKTTSGSQLLSPNVDELLNSLLDRIYPVGSIYMS